MADDWPEFSIPDVGQTEAPAPLAPEPGVPSGSAPPAPGTVVAGSTPAPSPGPSAGDDDRIPKYRFDEVLEARRQAEAVNQRLIALLDKQMAATAPPEAPVATDDETARKQRIVQQLIDVDPRFGKLLAMGDRADAILATIDRAEQQQAAQAEEYERLAKTTVSSVHDAFAVAAMGQGKTGNDLPPETRQTLTDNFVAWVMQDPSTQRAQRYNARDTSLTTEFLTDWQRRFVDPYRRSTAATQIQQARRTAALPMGGGTSSPLGTPPPKTHDTEDEDAVFHRAYRDSMQRAEQS